MHAHTHTSNTAAGTGAHASRWPWLAMLGLWLLGCADDPTTVIDPGPTGPPSVRFVDPASGGEPTCASVGVDADARVPLLVRVNEIRLRPPGGCAGVAQCGRLVLRANGVLNNETAVKAVDLLVYKLGDPYHDGSVHQGTGEPDLLDVTIEVVSNETDEVLLDHDGEPLTDSLELITVVDCAAL